LKRSVGVDDPEARRIGEPAVVRWKPRCTEMRESLTEAALA
jgi:hypothetical protein